MNQVIFADWAVYRPLFMPVLEKTQARNDHYFADQIDKALSSDEAFLFLAADGFLVLQPCRYNGQQAVYVMFAWNPAGDAINRYQTLVEDLALRIGAELILLETKVKKLTPTLEANGWLLQKTVNGVARWGKPLQGGAHGRE